MKVTCAYSITAALLIAVLTSRSVTKSVRERFTDAEEREWSTLLSRGRRSRVREVLVATSDESPSHSLLAAGRDLDGMMFLTHRRHHRSRSGWQRCTPRLFSAVRFQIGAYPDHGNFPHNWPCFSSALNDARWTRPALIFPLMRP